MFIKIFKGFPTVHLTSEPSAQEEVQDPTNGNDISHVTKVIYNDRLELRATIRSFPKHWKINWFKGSTVLDLSQSKYDKRLSSFEGNKTVLCINEVTKDDEDVYRVEVYNDLGKGTSENVTLKVIGGK